VSVHPELAASSGVPQTETFCPVNVIVIRLSATPNPPEPGTWTRRRLVSGALALLVVAVVVVLVVVAAGGSAGHGGGGQTIPVAALPALHAGRAGPESMFTEATALTANPAGTLAALQQLGVDRVHVYLHWADIAPDPSSRRRPSFDPADPGAYPAAGWTAFDQVVSDAAARHIGVALALVAPPPAWASGPGAPDPGTQTQWRPSAVQFGRFVRAVATRYSGQYIPSGGSKPLPRVDFWSVWNEPNLGFQLAPQAIPNTKIEVSGRLYRGLVDAAWSAFQATGHGHDTILIGEVGPAGATFGNAPGLFAAMAPLRFLRALYCVDASYRPLTGAAGTVRGCPSSAVGSRAFATAHPGLFRASGFADHPYPQGLPPNAVTPNEPDYAELAEVGKLERTLDTLQRVYGSRTRFPIWSTEYGYQTTPPDTESGTVSQTAAAYYLNWSEYLTWLDPRLRSFDQYLLMDPASGRFASGLRTSNGTPKPGYYAYRMPIFLPVRATKQGHPLEVWGCVRPAPGARRQTHRSQRVTIQFRPASGGSFRTIQTVALTGPHGYFDVPQKFPGSGATRLAWAYPHGRRIFSRTVDISLR